MTATIVSALLPFAIKIISAWFEKNQDKKEAREAFLSFVEKMQSNAGNSASLRKSYQAQIERLKKVQNGNQTP